MAIIQTTFAVKDYRTRPLQAMNRGVPTLVSAMESMAQTMDTNIDTSALEEARNHIAQATATFDAIAAKASKIQGRGVYGDKIMVAGAAEFATYFNDAEAIITPAKRGRKAKGGERNQRHRKDAAAICA